MRCAALRGKTALFLLFHNIFFFTFNVDLHFHLGCLGRPNFCAVVNLNQLME